MEKIVFRNKFRVIDAEGKKVRLNSTTNKNGSAVYIEGFETEKDAISALMLYCQASNDSIANYRVESYSENYPMIVPVVKNERVNSGLAKLKVFSGKGLKFNTDYHLGKSDNKYKPDKYYTKEVWLAQSTERNKGVSLINKKGDSKKYKNAGVVDEETALKMSRLRGGTNEIHTSFDEHLINSLIKQNFKSAQDLKAHLRSKGYSARWANKIFAKVYKQLHNG